MEAANIVRILLGEDDAPRITGEYWITDSGVWFADGDIGDMNHEMYARDHAIRRMLDLFNADSDEEYYDAAMFRDALIEALNEDGIPATPVNWQIEAKRVLSSMTPQPPGLLEIFDTAAGGGDAREVAVHYFGWIWVRGSHLSIWNYSREYILSGLNEIIEQEMGDPDQDWSNLDLDIFVASMRKHYYLTFGELESGRTPGKDPTWPTVESLEDEDLIKDVTLSQADLDAQEARLLPEVIQRKERIMGKRCLKTMHHTNPQRETYIFGKFGRRNSTMVTLLYLDPEQGWITTEPEVDRTAGLFGEDLDNDDLRDVYRTDDPKPYLPMGTVIRATTIEKDLIEAFLYALQQVAPQEAQMLQNEYEELPKDELQEFLWEKVDRAMNRHVPPYTYFGAHQGDMTDYGVWVNTEKIDDDLEFGSETTIFAVRPGQEIPSGKEYVVIVNPDGTYIRLLNGFTGDTIWEDE